MFSHRAPTKTGQVSQILPEWDKDSQQNAPRKVRSPKVFYEQMMTFKERKETKLKVLRNLKLEEEDRTYKCHRQRSVDIKKSEVLSNRSVPLVRKKSEAEADAFFRKLSTENLKK